MKVVVYGDDSRYIEWAQSRIGVEFRNDARVIGLACDDPDHDALPLDRDSEGRKILAAVIYDGFSSIDCNMHIASDGSKTWLNRELLIKAFAYPFVQCGLRRVTGLVPETNDDALRFDLNLGFRLEGRVREASKCGADLLILGMLKRECRFLSKEHNPCLSST